MKNPASPTDDQLTPLHASQYDNTNLADGTQKIHSTVFPSFDLPLGKKKN